MSKSKLLIALTAGLLASSAVLAQSNSSQGAMTPNTATSSDDSSMAASAPMKKSHKMKHTSKMSSTGNNAAKTKTPDVTTAASAATENGQGQ